MVRLEAGTGWPWWATYSAVASVTRTPTETSVIAEERLVPPGLQAERDFVLFAVEGPLAFTEVGILSSLTATLAAASISAVAVSTYDTDLVLVRAHDAERAAAAWRGAGWDVITS